MQNINQIYAIIKNLYLKNHNPVSLWIIYAYARKYGIARDEVPKALKYLHAKGKIKLENNAWIPILDFEELKVLEKKKNITVTLEKIKYCIKTYFEKYRTFPTSSELEKEFLSNFGFPNIKDFTRFIRQLAERNILKRTHDFRYYLDMNYYEKPLNKFLVKT